MVALGGKVVSYERGSPVHLQWCRRGERSFPPTRPSDRSSSELEHIRQSESGLDWLMCSKYPAAGADFWDVRTENGSRRGFGTHKPCLEPFSVRTSSKICSVFTPRALISSLTTYWSESIISSSWLGWPASRHGSLSSLFQVVLHLPSWGFNALQRNLIRKAFQFKRLLAMKFTTQHHLY